MNLPSIRELSELSGKTAIVTGGAVGIGYGISYRLAEAGAAVVIADKNKANAEHAAQELTSKGWKATPIEIDVSIAEDVQRAIQIAVDAYGRLDILVNNAGIFPMIPVMDLQESDFDRIIATNLKGVCLATQAAARRMIEQGHGGRIINITSIDAIHPSSVGLATYDASKHGVWGFTKNVALELAPHKIWVNAIAPGGINTPGATGDLTTQQIAANPTMTEFLKKIPMGRMGEPDDIGRAALFLASDLSSYMTGAQIVVDGGYLLA